MNTDTDTLTARQMADGICVEDVAGGVWWPNEEAASEIEASADPSAAALRICREQPMRGRWSQ